MASLYDRAALFVNSKDVRRAYIVPYFTGLFTSINFADIPPDMTTEERIDKAALELVEEILTAPEGVAWFVLVRAKLARLVMELRAKNKP